MLKRISLVIATSLALFGCQGDLGSLGGPVEVAPVEPGSSPSYIVTPTGTQTVSGKVDLLLMVDDSGSMGDKQELLRKSLPDLVRRLVSPNCIDASGTVLGKSVNGFCANGFLEFSPVDDLHVGIVTSSLGTPGGDLCAESLGGLVDRKAHLVTTGALSEPVADASAGFLSFGPGGITNPAQLIDDVSALVSGVGTTGCGLESQLEAWYRFLVEPNPYDTVVVDADGIAHREGTDVTVLQQRHDFLRPDSLLSIVMVTDEDDGGIDPVSFGGRGWGFANTHFPGSTAVRSSNVGTTAPRPTSACATDPGSSACTSCIFALGCSDGSAPSWVDCSAVANDPACATPYYGAADDDLGARFFQGKSRYGVDPQFPLERYVQGLLSAKVPSRADDHDADGRYTPTPTCDNPIFAPLLPTSADEELCHLTAGPRSQRLVVLSVIAGAPPDLLHPNMTPNDWVRVVGANPSAYVFDGIDPHMVQSKTPRPGLPGPSAANDADPVHGREWETDGQDLEYACIFALDAPRACGDVVDSECDCRELVSNLPICDGASPMVQVAAKAYPGVRPLRLAQLLGDNAVASSICPSPTAGPVIVPGDGPPTGYTEALYRLGNRMAQSLLPAPPSGL